MVAPPKRLTARPAAYSPCDVTEADLTRLDVLHQMLRVLNDSLAGAPQIAAHVDRFPALRARVMRRFRERFPDSQATGTSEQIAQLGNRDFERILLQLLEDLTELRANMP